MENIVRSVSYERKVNLEGSLFPLDFMNHLLESISDPVTLIDSKFIIHYINLPGNAQELVGQNCYQKLWGRNKPCNNCPVEKALNTKKPAGLEKWSPKNGNLLWTEIRAYPIWIDSFQEFFAFKICLDQTNQQNEERKRKRKINQIEYTLNFISSHRFNTIQCLSVDGLKISLTLREHQVLKLLSQGLTNLDIASALGLSPHTIKTHIISIFNKIGVSDRTQTAVWATRQGLI